MKVALAHEYFAAHGGAERVVEVLHAMWPEAPVYTFFHDRGRYGDLGGWDVRTSYLQQFPIGGGLHRALLPLYPSAARRLRVADDTDVVLVSTSAFIKDSGSRTVPSRSRTATRRRGISGTGATSTCAMRSPRRSVEP